MASFDEARGLGAVTEAGGDETLGFHCAEIADGSRSIEAGAAVAFMVGPAHGGRWEARGLARVGQATREGAS